MAKARMLSTKAGSDPDLNSMSIEAELIFLLTIPHLDRDGLISGDPIPLWGKVAPRRVELMDKMPRIIQEWVEHNLVLRYAWKDGHVLFFKGFRKHNANMVYEREPESDLPPPPGFHRLKGGYGLMPDDRDYAGRLAEWLGDRSKYCAALTEAAKQGQKNVDISLHVNYMQTTCNLHAEVEVEQQTEVEVEGKENNNSALHTLTLAEAETAVVVVGVPVLLQAFDHDQAMALLSWLWLYNGYNQEDLFERDRYRREYKNDPFAGMVSPAAVMVSNAKAKMMAPLSQIDREDMMDRLSAVEHTS
jgi:hypothetical protein